MTTFVLALVLVGCHPAAQGPAAPSRSDGPANGASPSAPVGALEAWQTMATTLPGRWTAEFGDRQIDVTYRLVSKGTALVETWGSGGGETVSVYHRADDGLAMTHYCGQGNQPYLQAASADAKGVIFERSRVTSWKADASVLDKLEFRFAAGELVRRETYVGHDGSEEETVLHFVRKP